MFEELGLNVARQPDNGANPRPGQPLGLAGGRDARRRRGAASTRAPQAEDAGDRGHACGTPPTQLRFARQATRSRRAPTARRTAGRRESRGAERCRHAVGSRTPMRPMIDIEARLDELRALGLHRRMRHGQRARRARASLLDGKPVLLLCSNNYLGLADHPRVREAAADAAMRWGVGAGASRLVSGTMTIHRRLEERLADVQGQPRRRCCSARATWPTSA